VIPGERRGAGAGGMVGAHPDPFGKSCERLQAQPIPLPKV